MKKQYRSIIITAIILTILISNYIWISATGNTRAVESLSSFAMGALTGILILQVGQLLRDRKNNNNK